MNLGEILTWTSEWAGCAQVPADSQVYLEAPADVRRVLVGIDIDVAELLVARELGVDAVIAHHPVGDRATLDFAKVVERQVQQMGAEGIDEATARAAVAQRMGPRERGVHMANVNRVVDTGRLLGVPFCNIHLACDIVSRQVVVDTLREHDRSGATVGDALGWLRGIPEIGAAPAGPAAWVGSADDPLGRWTVAMAGGTNGGFPVFREYWRAGVDTIFAMHCAESDVQQLRAEAAPGKNLVVTGHMGTDSIGINRMAEGLRERGIEVLVTSGVVTR